jgi:hypothetical protein
MDATPIQINSYDMLITTLRDRICQVGTTFAGVDQIAGLCDHYASKVLRPKAAKGLGPTSLFCILGALGLKLALIPDDAAIAKLKRRSDWQPIRRNGPRYRRHIRRKK